MPDVTACLHPGEVRRWISFDQHKFSIVAAVLPADGGKPEVCRIETTEKAIRRFIDKQGGPVGLSVCYEAGPGGFALWRLLTKMGVACDVVAPSLIPVRAGDRVKTDRRDAKKLVSLYRAGLLRFVHPPTPELEGLRDLLRARDDLRTTDHDWTLDGSATPCAAITTSATARSRRSLPLAKAFRKRATTSGRLMLGPSSRPLVAPAETAASARRSGRPHVGTTLPCRSPR
jgi:Transposase